MYLQEVALASYDIYDLSGENPPNINNTYWLALHYKLKSLQYAKFTDIICSCIKQKKDLKKLII